MTEPEADALTGPVPVWRDGYEEDEPIYKELRRVLREPRAQLAITATKED